MQQVFEELATQRRLLFHSAVSEIFNELSTADNNLLKAERTFTDYEPCILILYVGGTLGMVKDAVRGYIPKENYLRNFMYHHPGLCDQEYTKKNAKGEFENFFYSPESPFGKRLRYMLKEFKPLLDSTDMNQHDWVRIAKTIADNYNKFDAFIILHGTDTIALTASALSFMLENLRKAVIITASMIPLFEMRNDAINNIICSLLIAGHYWIPEVAVMVNNKLYRGNRVLKESSHEITAIKSPKCPPLVDVGTSIEVNWPLIHYVKGGNEFKVFTKLETRVTLVVMTPYMTEKVFKAMMSPEFKGIILETYGTGNFPSNRPELLDIVKNVIAKGVVVVNISQCRDSIISDSLGDGKLLTDLGVINGRDMTAQCAITKLSYLLGKYPVDKVKRKFKRNLRGELTEDINTNNSNNTMLGHTLMDDLTNSMGVVLCSDQYKSIASSVYPALIIQAAAEGDVKVLEKLRSEGADLNVLDPELRTAAHVAAMCGKGEVIKYIIKQGFNIDRVDKYSSSPLYYAIKRKHYAIATDLLNAGGVFKSTYNQVLSILFS